jgi:6-phosphogluconolactonase/glucosamine-6-phosphate isomerase/deaminase
MVTLLPDQGGVTMTAPVIMEGNSMQGVDYGGEKAAILNGLFEKPSITENLG